MQNYLITGANRGLGLELTRQALALGHSVVATCRDLDNAGELASFSGKLSVHELEVTDEAAISALASTLHDHPLDVLINNAGLMAEHQSPEDMNKAEWMDSFAVNTIAPWQTSLAFRNQLEKAAMPRVVTLTSQMGSLERAGSDRVAYRSSKTAANMAMRTLAIAWRDAGISVCMMHPGWVRTDMGGSDAALDTQESAAGMLSVIERLTINDTGRFLDYQGIDIPW